MSAVTQSGRGMSAYLSRFLMAMRAGLSFGTARDTYKVFGYPRKITHEMMRDRVMRQDIVKTCLYKPAEAIWTNPPIVGGPEDFVTAWNAFVKKHKLWSVMLRADKLLGVEPYVALFLGTEGAPDKPVTKTRNIAYVQPYGASSAAVPNLDSDTSSERFGRPLRYTLSAVGSASNQSLTAHWTRCIHLTNELTDDNNNSAPRILAAYNLFDDIIKCTGGSAETFWLTANRGMQVDIDKEMELDEDEANALSDELDEFQHQLRRYIRTRGVKITSLGSEVADPRGTFDVLMALLAGTYGIPQRVLMGSEAGQLASEQDRANWAQVVEARRTSVAEPYMLVPVIEGLQRMGILPETDEYTFTWPDAFHMSPLESAQTMAQSARALVNLSRQAQYGTPVCTTEEARLICGLPEAPAEGQTWPKMPAPANKNGTLEDKKPASDAKEDPTATDVTGTDQGSDGVADTKDTKTPKTAE